jgi:hypothetical protein
MGTVAKIAIREPSPQPSPKGRGSQKVALDQLSCWKIFFSVIAGLIFNPSVPSQSEAFFPLSLRVRPAMAENKGMPRVEEARRSRKPGGSA